MQRQIIHGVPYFLDSQNRLFPWDTETSSQPIGQYNPATDSILYADDHLVKFTGKLAVWREQQKPRLRKAGDPKSRSAAGGAAAGGSTEGFKADK
jgi:hypothetical protein